MQRLALSVALASATLLAPSGSSFDARVTRVIDGDSLEVEAGGETIEIRLFGIDSPERDQPYADAARAALARHADGKKVRIEVRDKDAYGRTVARVVAGAVDVNRELVREGAAWVYRRYTDDAALLSAEQEARRERRGLWAQTTPAPVPPWDWRHSSKSRDKRPQACGDKRYCREMSSCSEARFYLEQCGLARLDGDGDGVPCETICRRGR